MYKLILAFFFGTCFLFGAININTASKEELQGIKGIGEKKAEAIIKYREDKGAFKSIDELVEVPGIGKKILDSIREELTIDTPEKKN